MTRRIAESSLSSPLKCCADGSVTSLSVRGWASIRASVRLVARLPLEAAQSVKQVAHTVWPECG